MPTNMYGPGDNYHPENSHVLPAFIRRFHLAKMLENEDWRELERIFSRERTQRNSKEEPQGSMPHAPCQEELMSWLAKSGIFQTTSNQQPVTKITCWGSGSPLREFLYSDDLAEACVFLLENVDYDDVAFEDESGTVQSHINVGSGREVTIKELAETVKEVIGFKGAIEWDTSKPDGTPRKLMDSSRLRDLGWTPSVGLVEGIAQAYEDFKARYT